MAISLAIRQKIIEFYNDGLSKHQIATRLKESRTSVIRISSVTNLTKSLQQEWKKISADQIRKICAAAPGRLKAIAEKEGQHVE